MGSYGAYQFGSANPNASPTPFGMPTAQDPYFTNNRTTFSTNQAPQSARMDATRNAGQTSQSTSDPAFDILEWHPAYQSCQRYFLDHSQHEPATQALCALINIRLPFQWLQTPITSSNPSQGPSSGTPNSNLNPFGNGPGSNARSGSNSFPTPNRSRTASDQPPPVFLSLVSYIRRLVVTGFDKPGILHGLFGDDYPRGVLPHVECERRNYLFAAKHGGWRSCKKQYDQGSGGGGDETCPFMKPLEESTGVEELEAAEKAWSHWLAMEDWMVGPRAPGDTTEEGTQNSGSVRSSQQGAGSGAARDGMSAASGRRAQGEMLPDTVIDGVFDDK